MNRLVSALDRFFYGLMLSVGVVVVVTVAVISYGVFAREVLHRSDIWITESTTYLMGYLTFVGGASLAWQGRHLKVDVLNHFVGLKTAYVLEMVACALVAAVAAVMMCLTATFWWDAWTSNEKSWGMLSIPLWIPYLSLFVGELLFFVAQTVKLLLFIGRHSRDPSAHHPHLKEGV
jgi:TRAP-type C4-dicarboxylate transport system permease small subunit